MLAVSLRRDSSKTNTQLRKPPRASSVNVSSVRCSAMLQPILSDSSTCCLFPAFISLDQSDSLERTDFTSSLWNILFPSSLYTGCFLIYSLTQNFSTPRTDTTQLPIEKNHYLDGSGHYKTHLFKYKSLVSFSICSIPFFPYLKQQFIFQ